jgi:hypothetical protein
MVDAVGLAGFVLELTTTAHRATGCIGGAGETAGWAILAPPIGGAGAGTRNTLAS